MIMISTMIIDTVDTEGPALNSCQSHELPAEESIENPLHSWGPHTG